MPIISVIIPTRHRNDLLALCLDRLAPGRQTLDAADYEVIVSDDGVDSTAQSMIRDRYPWARWAPGPCRGPASNRNNGVGHAQGDFLAFTDDDCLPAPQWLTTFRVAADAARSEVFEGKTTCSQGIRSCLDEAPVNLTGGALWSCNMMIRRAVFERLGGFDEDFPTPYEEDVEFCERVRRAGYTIQFVPEAIVDHPRRRRPSGWRMGLRWENRVLRWYKEGNVRSVASWLPYYLLKVRISQILEYPMQGDSLRAIAALSTEFVCVVTHLPKWERKYRDNGRSVGRAAKQAGRERV